MLSTPRYLTRSSGGLRLPKLSKYSILLAIFLYATRCIPEPHLLSKLMIANSNLRGLHSFFDKFNFIHQHSFLQARYIRSNASLTFRCFFYRMISLLSKQASVSAITSSLEPNLFPQNTFFRLAKSQQSLGARSGEYGGWGRNSKLNSFNLTIVFMDLWPGALPWWNSTFFFCI